MIRLAPGQDPEDLSLLVENQMRRAFKKLDSPNKLDISISMCPEFEANVEGELFQAATTAIKEVL